MGYPEYSIKKIFNWQLASDKIKPNGGGGGNEYTYTEVDISSATLINPPLEPNTGQNGVLLLPPLSANQYYEWIMHILFIPGSITYDPVTTPLFLYASRTNLPYLNPTDIEYNEQLIWQFSSYSTLPVLYLGQETIIPISTGSAEFYSLLWSAGDFTTGDGTMKVKIWYKVVAFG
jgi:hypothetical protein